MGPLPGYWRSSNVSTDFVKCPYPQACLGMVAPDYNLQGSCKTGYLGILCTGCDVGYSRAFGFECLKCPNPVGNIVKLIFIVIILIIAVGYLIRSTLAGAKQTNNVTSIYLKILMNHI